MSLTRRALAVLAVLLATAAPIAAKTYRWVDEQGTVHYTDHPPPKKSVPVPESAPAPTPQRDEPSASPSAVPAAPAPAAPPTPAPATRPTPPAPTHAAPAPPPAAISAPQTPPAPVPAAPPAVAPERRDDHAALARELIELAGMDRSLEHLADIGRRAVSTSAWRRRDAHRVWPTLMPLLRRDVLAKPATACLARHLETGHATEVLAWLRSPLGNKVQKLEAVLSNPAGYEEYRKFVTGLPEGKIAQARLEVVQSMAERGRLAEQQTELESAMRTAIGRVLGQPAADEDDESRYRLASEEHNRFWAVTAMLFAYQRLTEAELQTYDRFDRSPAGIWFTNLYWECLRETVKATEQRATEALKSLRTTGQASPAAR